MKVLLTGATGFLGGAIAHELVGAGHDVRALVRATSKLTNLADLRLERVEGDVSDAAAVKRALEGCDGVVHTAGVTSWRPQDRDLVHRVNVTGTTVVLEAALAAKVKRAVATSSGAAIGGARTPRVLDETASWDEALLGGLFYMRSKWEGDKEARRLAAQGLPVVILNPGFILGPGDIYKSSATIVLSIARGSIPGYVEGGFSCCDVRDVAKAHVAALEGKGKPGERYILGGHNVTTGEFFGRVSALAGRRKPSRIPYPIAYLFARFAELRGRSDMNRQLIRAGSLYSYYDSAKAVRELGYDATRPLDDMIRDTLRFFLSTGRLAPSSPELQALAPAPAVPA